MFSKICSFSAKPHDFYMASGFLSHPQTTPSDLEVKTFVFLDHLVFNVPEVGAALA
jgi:hypothetical protein